jgi:hypothetical protein
MIERSEAASTAGASTRKSPLARAILLASAVGLGIFVLLGESIADREFASPAWAVSPYPGETVVRPGGFADVVATAQDVLGRHRSVLDLDVLEHPIGEAELAGEVGMWVPGRTRTNSVACAAVRVIRGSMTIMLARLSSLPSRMCCKETGCASAGLPPMITMVLALRMSL